MDIRVVQHLSQKLALSPQIRQYLKLLQLPAAELQSAVEEALAENPILEMKNSDDSSSAERIDESAQIPDKEKFGAYELQLGKQYGRLSDESASGSSIDESWDPEEPRERQKQKDFQDTLLTKGETLADYLTGQITFLDFTRDETNIAEEIIGNLNPDGYLTVSVEEIAAQKKWSLEKISRVLERLQTLDPAGIFARNLQESLRLQLLRKNPAPPIALRMVDHYFPLVVKRDWAALAKLEHISFDEVRKAAGIIASLDPKPGREFDPSPPITIVPDISVSSDEDGAVRIDSKDEIVPELRINPYYRKLLRDPHADEKTKAFIREKIQSAMNFINAMQLRRSTLRDITAVILKKQPDFLTHGFSHLKPLRLKDVADELDIHESTVSRAISGKHITTPQGTIPFKSFFSSKLQTADGEDESQRSIMQKIRGIIEKENPQKPLSDQAIGELLKADGIKVARRTVAKYRELLKILPSHLRKQR